MKKIWMFLSVLVVVLLVGVMLKDQIIKNVVKVGVAKVTGAPVAIDNFSLGVLNQSVRIEGLRIYHPKGFPQGILLDIPVVQVDYDIAALLTGKIHLKKIELNINEVGVVRNKEGVLNVDALTAVQEAKKEKPKEAPQKETAKEPAKKAPAKAMDLQIDELKLSVGKVVYGVYPAQGEPAVSVFDVGIKDKIYKNITSPQQLVVLILSEPMKATTIKGAGIYGAATVLGMGFLPVGVAATLMGKDSAAADFSAPIETVYAKSIEAISALGKVVKEDKARNLIKASVQGASVTVQLRANEDGTVHAEASAKKLLLPKPEIAGGVIYELTERLK